MKLKPCPFCGGEAEVYEYESSRDIYDHNTLGYVDTEYFTKYGCACHECGCIVVEKNSEEEAIAAWNRRDPMDKVVEQLKEIQMGEYSAKAEYVQGMNGNSIAYCDGAINTIEKAIEIVKGGEADE